MAVLLLGLASTGSAAHQPELRFVTKPFAPYSYADDRGQAAGPMVDLLYAACARLQWRCTVQVLPWRRAWGLAQRGQVDGVFPIVDSPARRAVFQLSPAVVAGRYVLVGRAEAASPCQAGRCDLAGRTIGVYGPSDAAASVQQLAQRTPGVQAEVELDHDTVLRKLMHGRYGDDGLALVNEAVALRLQGQGGAPRLRQAAVLKDLAYAYAFTPGTVDATRMAEFSAAIEEFCQSGHMTEIFAEHGLTAASCLRKHLRSHQKKNFQGPFFAFTKAGNS